MQYLLFLFIFLIQPNNVNYRIKYGSYVDKLTNCLLFFAFNKAELYWSRLCWSPQSCFNLFKVSCRIAAKAQNYKKKLLLFWKVHGHTNSYFYRTQPYLQKTLPEQCVHLCKCSKLGCSVMLTSRFWCQFHPPQILIVFVNINFITFFF